MAENACCSSRQPVHLADNRRSRIRILPTRAHLYNIETDEYILYADRRLQQKQTIANIADKFELAQRTFVVRSDAHYRS